MNLLDAMLLAEGVHCATKYILRKEKIKQKVFMLE